MAAKKETENSKTTRKTQTASKRPSASSAGAKQAAKKGTAKGAAGRKNKEQAERRSFNFPILEEVIIWGALALSVILFISNFGIGGFVGNAVSGFFFGVFGLVAYIFPVILFLVVSFLMSNKDNIVAWMKAAAVLLLIVCICTALELLMNQYDAGRSFLDFYTESTLNKSGGGLAGGVLCTLICPAFGIVGGYVIVFVMIILCLVLITERSLFENFRRTGRKVYENAREDAQIRRERAALREEKQAIIRSEQRRRRRERLEEEKRELEKLPEELRRNQKVSGVNLSELSPSRERPGEVHEIIPPVPKRKPEVPQVTLKVMDFTIQGDGFEVPPKERGQKESPELPFVDMKFEEPELYETEDFEKTPVIIKGQRPSSFEEQLRINGELVYKQEEAEEKEEFCQDDGLNFTGPLREPLFLQKAEPDEEQEIFAEEYEPENMLESMTEEGSNDFQDEWTETEEPMDFGDMIEIEEPPVPSGRTKSTNVQSEQAGVKGPESREASFERPIKNPKSTKEEQEKNQEAVAQEIELGTQAVKREYVFPPIDLLKKQKGNPEGNRDQELRETAMKLQQTLHNFGVGVHVTNVSCGPTVTRYELTPDQGVKVSRIVNLSDDIKLNLAAADIRIEAPIPGKAAVGIEVPNKTNSPVPLRELLESREFENHASNLAFAAGKDIAGKVVVADIARMPHLLIAGATGSGKSVCINTIIMSLLYKAKPEDVKLIMIDPKVVELSVYNGIPHLLIPVVTDPKKASGALNWAVAEMTGRYQKFAECNVRDLKGYNKKVEALENVPGEGKPEKMPQIVIIVDELADLMMVAPGEVEDAICRLAQLARAAGIHLIIATQRPSVNVITGLIKANMPSRIAFAVSSGVDSRTIIDMVGAEKLLGKGDMLFYPQGYPKPARVQGAFVSDGEVAEVAKFLADQNSTGVFYSSDIEAKITSSQGLGGGDGGDAASEIDEYFEKAGRFIIEKDKASIGMLQRLLKIGFNRAARIMDQLADAGVVGPEEGTKPRKILMSMEQFEDYLSDYV